MRYGDAVLIAVERLLIRIKHPASRADELNALRARLRTELARAAASAPTQDDTGYQPEA